MKLIRLSGTVIALCLMALPAHAGEPSDVVKSVLERAYALVTDPELRRPDKVKERAMRVRELDLSFWDMDETARLALEKHWEQRTSTEQKEYLDLFRVIAERGATPNPDQGEEWAKSVVDGEKVDGEFAEVYAHFIMRVARDIPMTYRLRRTNGAWKLYDWGSFGRSFIANYRAQFNRIIVNSSFEGLLTALRQKKELIEKRIAAGDPLLVSPFAWIAK
ncbi:MAG TPA: ABC transporter substrate-binding protein [Candidatus Binatia bacterium]|nr:ABC transporter substrate-binding protein [Candidatus Binatia bacterium]